MSKKGKIQNLKEAFDPTIAKTPRDSREYVKEVPILVRILSALMFLVLSFAFTRSTLFKQYPMFGLNTLAETVIAGLCAVFGYYIFPVLLVSAKHWIEDTITKAITDIVANFWELQTKRIQEARREKQKRKLAVETAKLKQDLDNSVLVDTSVLVDGRILDILKTGFFDKTLIIPQSVIDELHLISDNKDKIKRQRGRQGLDVVKEVKKYTKVVSPEIKSAKEGVDKQLVEFAKENKLKLLTLDFNLNKVAQIVGVKVLNINDLVNALKTILLPGEQITVKIIQEGKEKEQGVGYMTDGTMLIVENARSHVGEELSVKVAKVIQSAAGKIVFCEFIG